MFFKYNIFTILWGLLILAVCLLPGRDIPQTDIWQFDKIVHASIFAVFAVLMIGGFYKQYSFAALRYNPVKAALIIGILYGLSLEAIQGVFLKDRYFDMFDAAANTIGCLAGSAYFKLIYKI